MKDYFHLLIVACPLAVAGCGNTPTTSAAKPETRSEREQPAPAAQPVQPEKSTPPETQVPPRPSKSRPSDEMERALARAKAEGKMVVVEISASWCPPCMQMKRDTFANAQVQARLAQFVTLFVDADDDADFNQRLGVRGIPAFVVVRPDRAIIKSGSGYMGPKDFLHWLDGAR